MTPPRFRLALLTALAAALAAAATDKADDKKDRKPTNRLAKESSPYLPPEDREVSGEKLDGFKTIMKRVLDDYKAKPDEVKKKADQVAAETRTALAGAARGANLVALDRGLVDGVVEHLKGRFDKTY